MTTRKRFEKWATSSGWDVGRTAEGSYRTATTDAAWGGWLAAVHDSEDVHSRACIEWANICEKGRRHGAKVGATECGNLIRGWRVLQEGGAA